MMTTPHAGIEMGRKKYQYKILIPAPGDNDAN